MIMMQTLPLHVKMVHLPKAGLSDVQCDTLDYAKSGTYLLLTD